MRRTAAAGAFYPGDPDELLKTVNGLIEERGRGDARAAIAPHAGYPYSGSLAAESCGAVDEFKTYVLVGPNHTGVGKAIALSDQDWSTPLGRVPVNRKLVRDIDIPVDESSHSREHSLEVLLPILQVLHDGLSIVPVCMRDQGPEAARVVAEELEPHFDSVGVLVSSDLTHHAPLSVARERDERFIERILELDEAGLYGEASTGSFCGYGPVAVAVELALRSELEPSLLGYSTSEAVTGDDSSVVGYCSVSFT
ncbi:MAG: hypothetical protein MAG715_00697 [Methanonatronarchaeales archaeon]|nr:hypothetical protein [Methanonatronarchaeales archaeon]